MGAEAPLVMALDARGAEREVVGGTGASLARLSRAGFRVPPGFHVTTSAYLGVSVAVVVQLPAATTSHHGIDERSQSARVS